jgi:gluconokinase
MDQQHNTIRWVVMGVCGAGKSTVGKALAQATGATYVEGDTFHPEANVAKMKAGLALDDHDRAGWLGALAEQLKGARERGDGMVVGCSALKRRYRDLLRSADPHLRFAHLAGPRDLIAQRMQQRVGHYMPTSLLDSQLRDLEPLQPDEAGLILDISAAPDQLVQQILASERDRT